MAGVGLANADDGQPVAAAFGWQVEVGDFGKLLLQDRHEHLVQRQAEHGGFIRRFAGVGGVIDRVAPVRQSRDLEHRKPFLFVVIPGVVAKRTLECVKVAVHFLQSDAAFAFPSKPGNTGGNRAFQDDFRRRRNLQHHARITHRGLGQLGAAAAQQAGELVLGKTVRHRRHGTQHRRRVGAERHCDRKSLPWLGEREFSEVERAAAVRQPAHDDLPPADHLLPIDTQVLPLARPRHALWPAGDHEAPGDQRPRIVRPAGLNRKARQVNVGGLKNDLLAGRRAHQRRFHVPQRLDQVKQPARVLHPARRFRLLEARQHRANLAQF